MNNLCYPNLSWVTSVTQPIFHPDRKLKLTFLESNPRDSPPCGHRPSSISSLNQRDPRDPGPSGFVPRTGQQQNSIFSSPSLPNIAQAVRNNEGNIFVDGIFC